MKLKVVLYEMLDTPEETPMDTRVYREVELVKRVIEVDNDVMHITRHWRIITSQAAEETNSSPLIKPLRNLLTQVTR